MLARDGVIRAIWRVPGRLANRGIWTTADATALHDALSSLPMWPYMDVVVTPLAAHPLDAVCGGLATAGRAPLSAVVIGSSRRSDRAIGAQAPRASEWGRHDWGDRFVVVDEADS